MSRATAWSEIAGIPSVAIACKGFTTTVRLVARAEGLSGMRIVEYPPPNIGVQDRAPGYEGAAKIIDEVISALTRPLAAVQEEETHDPSEDAGRIVFKGQLQQVNDFFRQRVWSDGLPVIPPTRVAVDAMLGFTDHGPGDVIGVLPPKRLAATAWKIAVNGVMAGCRPEYMPLLIAIVEAIAEPRFGLEHAGSTVGWTPLIILNGPIIKELGFNSGEGVLRPEAQANITVGRFLRLCMVNIAGYRVGETDMASFGRTYYAVLGEAEDQSPWPPLSTDRGFNRGENVVTVQSADTISHGFLTEGDGTEHLRILAQEVALELGGAMLLALGNFGNEVSPLVCVTPLVAGIVAKSGYSKKDVQNYLFEHARIPAHHLDTRLNRHQPGLALKPGQAIKLAIATGKLPEIFALSDDPDRLIPVVHKPEEFFVVVSGSPTRNRSFVAAQFGNQGLNVSKRIRLPKNWNPERRTS